MLPLVVFLQGWFNSKVVSICGGQLERQVVGFSVSGLTSHLARLNTPSACLPDLHSPSVESCLGQGGGFRGINHRLKPCNPATSFPKLARLRRHRVPNKGSLLEQPQPLPSAHPCLCAPYSTHGTLNFDIFPPTEFPPTFGLCGA